MQQTKAIGETAAAPLVRVLQSRPGHAWRMREILEQMPGESDANLSYHLKRMRDRRQVRSTKRGKYRVWVWIEGGSK